MSIPLNNIVKINPGVLDVGNNGNNLFGLMLTKKPGLVFGQTTTFTSADQVGKLFGFDTKEYSLANVYFAGFTNSDRVAEQLYIAPYYTVSPLSLIGASLSGLTLEELCNFTGKLSILIDTTQYTLDEVDLSGATSFRDAASKLNAMSVFDSEEKKIQEKVITFTYSSENQSIVIISEKGCDKISACGELATSLCLTEKEGAKVSPRIEKEISVTETLNTLRQKNLSFCSVFLAWDLDELIDEEITPDAIKKDRDEKLELAKWANSMKDDVCVILNDSGRDNKATDSSTIMTPVTDEDQLSFAEIVKNRNYEGVVCTYKNLELCAFIAGYPAAWDLTKTDGRFTAAFRRNSLLKANVNDASEAITLKAKGYNFYGVWASSTSSFTFMYEGRISGQYVWLDSWFCQVWMRRQLQYYFMMTLLARGQIPYNTDGKGILTTAIKPALDQYMNFGAIRSGISLADEQIQQLKQAGLNQSQINNITTVGYYLKVDMERVSPQTRVKRGSPPINFWYTDGQSVQQINMNSIEIQ